MNEVHDKSQALVHSWVRYSINDVDVIPFLQEGNSAAAAIDRNARRVSSGEGSAHTKRQREDEALVRLREAAEGSRRVAREARTHSD